MTMPRRIGLRSTPIPVGRERRAPSSIAARAEHNGPVRISPSSPLLGEIRNESGSICVRLANRWICSGRMPNVAIKAGATRRHLCRSGQSAAQDLLLLRMPDALSVTGPGTAEGLFARRSRGQLSAGREHQATRGVRYENRAKCDRPFLLHAVAVSGLISMSAGRRIRIA